MAEKVSDRFSLAKFIRALAEDCRRNEESWQNLTIYDFLESLSAWLPVADRYYENLGKVLPDEPSWLFFVEMILAAKVYE